ncbi:MAG: hypothetical protein GJT30_06615 [Geobacter sp.]|nr:hypothetical protein [Geobacter sp.]
MARLLTIFPCQIDDWCNICGGVGTNLISTIIELIIGVILIAIVVLIKQSSKKLFFLNGANHFIAMTSRLNVIESKDFRDQRRNFYGSAIPDYEIVALRNFSRIFNFDDTSLRDLPWIKKIMFLRFPTLAIEASPNREITNENDIPNSTTIFCIGSPGYNATSEYIENSANLARFINDNIALELGSHVSSHNPFIIQRVRRSAGGYYFYMAGCSIEGTTQAINNLILNWKSYKKRFGKSDFAILFEIRNGLPIEVNVQVRS